MNSLKGNKRSFTESDTFSEFLCEIVEEEIFTVEERCFDK